ncbi:MAG: 2Fe-2S iron-sulfur cluster-binding protein [Cyanobacteria bacterium P01_F01_bin.150]
MAETYTVEINYQGEDHIISVPAEQTILEAATDAGLDLPYSCNAGLCVTCVAKVLSGEVVQRDADVIAPALQDAGFYLLCITHAKSDLTLEADKEEEVYEIQYGG